MSAINAAKKVRFVVIIDEWDVLIRDESAREDVQKEYIDEICSVANERTPRL